jgi:cytochrome d ubiquinol oxidase subunit I
MMALDPVMLSRIQFAFVVSFRIIFPAFTVGLDTFPPQDSPPVVTRS